MGEILSQNRSSQNAMAELDLYIRQKRYRMINSVLVTQQDKIVVERYYNQFNPEKRSPIKSIWKSILSITAGICLDKGWLKSIDEPVGTYLPAFNQKKHPYHRLITIRHLLTMSSGIHWNGGVHYHCPMMEQMFHSPDWVAYLSDAAMRSNPGSAFVYKEWDVILLSAVIGKATDSSSWDVCREYLYTPLGIGSEWPRSPCGISYPIMPNEHISDLTARELAKIGALVLHGGMFEGRRIVSSAYVRQAVSPSPAAPGYGLLWWLYPDRYGCRGYSGQEITVYPEKRAVIVLQASVSPSSKSYEDVGRKIVSEL